MLVGTFDEEFLKVPHEIICESMLTNQRYFPIYDGEGKLTREFVVVSNSKPENAERVIDGNERVVRARLDDAKFFYEEDLKISLDEFRERLAKVASRRSSVACSPSPSVSTARARHRSRGSPGAILPPTLLAPHTCARQTWCPTPSSSSRASRA